MLIRLPSPEQHKQRPSLYHRFLRGVSRSLIDPRSSFSAGASRGRAGPPPAGEGRSTPTAGGLCFVGDGHSRDGAADACRADRDFFVRGNRLAGTWCVAGRTIGPWAPFRDLTGVNGLGQAPVHLGPPGLHLATRHRQSAEGGRAAATASWSPSGRDRRGRLFPHGDGCQRGGGAFPPGGSP